MDFENRKRVSINKRIFYFLIFLIVALPVLAGVLAWYFTKTSDECSAVTVKDANQGDDTTTVLSEEITTTEGYSRTEPWKNLRLPPYIKPFHYDITLYPDFYGEDGTFYGKESIEVHISEETNFILVHINGLNMTSTRLFYTATWTSISVSKTFLFEENQFWVIEANQSIESGSNVTVELVFVGSLTASQVGFYKSTYVNSITNETRNLATSKFEPVSARRAFPCFDEPNIKAEYTVNLIHRYGYTALSNMPVKDTVPSTEYSGLEKTIFQRSVKMSTYLVCFIVCDFRFKEDRTSTGVRVRVYATPDKIDQVDYALQVVNYTTAFYEDLFGVKFPLPKLDMIAIPDFVSGAMEHWGLITYREVNILYNEQEASTSNKQRVGTVIAHEVAHQWFGNIVTMDWWDDLWLNEGFASFMEYIGLQDFEPEWDLPSQFLTQDFQYVMKLDSNPESHPIIVPVNEPNEINEVFDSITYSKGASIIRMLEIMMGHDNFFNGIQRYLEEHQWGNARTDDLWNALGSIEGAGKVKDIMDTWTLQMALPYVDVMFEERSGQHVAFLVQSRYLADKSITYDVSESPFHYKWFMAVDYITSTSPATTTRKWLNKDNGEISIDFNPQTNNTWIKLNHNQTGYYRVNYPDFMWRRFPSIIKANGIQEPTDRSGLISDVFNLARAGYLEYDVALDVSKYLNEEYSYLPWDSAEGDLVYIGSMLEGGLKYAEWMKYILEISKPVLDRLTWNDSGTHLERLHRIVMINLVCGNGEKSCLYNATQLFRDWIDNGQTVVPNLRSLVYKFGMENSESAAEDWDKMWNKYTTETIPQERIKLLYGMAKSREVWLLSRYLEYTKDKTKVRDQDFFSVLIYISDNPVGAPLVWNWVRANWEYMVDSNNIAHSRSKNISFNFPSRFTLFSRSLGRLVPRIVGGFNSNFKLSEVEAFFKQYPDAGAGERARKQAIETIKTNIVWMKRNEDTVAQWLANNII